MNAIRLALVAGTVLPGAAGNARAGDAPTPKQVVAQSIAYHDPAGVWERGAVELEVVTTYSDAFTERMGGRTAAVTLSLAPASYRFRYVKEIGRDVVEYRLSAGDTVVAVNGSETISDADRERLHIGDPVMYRDYFEYLYGMPMKLQDPGTVVDPDVKDTDFEGRDVWAVRVTYAPDVGKDIWYFYFDKGTFALQGYRFYHDETKNDGEHIVFEGEIRDEETGLRLPRTRGWYYNNGDGFLATDKIVSLRATLEP